MLFLSFCSALQVSLGSLLGPSEAVLDGLATPNTFQNQLFFIVFANAGFCDFEALDGSFGVPSWPLLGQSGPRKNSRNWSMKWSKKCPKTGPKQIPENYLKNKFKMRPKVVSKSALLGVLGHKGPKKAPDGLQMVPRPLKTHPRRPKTDPRRPPDGSR